MKGGEAGLRSEEFFPGIIPGCITCGADSVCTVTNLQFAAGAWFFLPRLPDNDRTPYILPE